MINLKEFPLKDLHALDLNQRQTDEFGNIEKKIGCVKIKINLKECFVTRSKPWLCQTEQKGQQLKNRTSKKTNPTRCIVCALYVAN
jgi:hypothetical protein